jgi:hypothetical protein
MVKTPPYATVPRSWVGETAVIIGCGPSLTKEDVASCWGQARVIAIKDAHRWAPWADVLYSGDELWWQAYASSLTFAGEKYACVVPLPTHLAAIERAGAKLLRFAGHTGLEEKPDGVRSGHHSGYQAIQLAVHFGVAKIILLGYDMQPGPANESHFVKDHPYKKKAAPYAHLHVYETLLEPLRALGVTVVNASRSSALGIFPRVSLDIALTEASRAA